MKKFSTIFVLLAFVFCYATAFADVRENKVNVWRANQIFKYGIEVDGSITINGARVNMPWSNVWYVDSASGANTRGNNQGKSWEKPFATVDYAINQCTANQGDVILVMPGHAESYSAANGFDADVAGVFIIGLGTGTDVPEFTFADTDATIAVGAANVTFANLRFLAGISDIVIGIAVEAAGDNFHMVDCEFPEPSTSTFDFLDAIDLASTADGVRVEYCRYSHVGTTGPNHFIEAGNGVNKDMVIRGNHIMGQFAVSAIWSNAIDLNALIQDNTIVQMTSGQHCIEFTTTATGMIADNRLYADAFGTTLDPGSMYCVGNLAASAINEAGTPIPAQGDSTDNYIGTNSANNDADSSSVAANRTGSLLERNEYIYDLLVDDETTNLLGVNDADNAAVTSAVVPNANGSALERIEAIAAMAGISYNHPNYLAVTTGTFDTTGTWSTAAAHEIAVVTGAVKMTIIPEINTTMSSVGDNGTMALGDETTTNSVIAATTIGAGLAAAGELWLDNSLNDTVALGSQIEAVTFIVANGKDIGYTVATNALSGGSMTFHIFWTPIDSTGAVTAGAGGAF